jgi:predicted secreted protein
MARHNGRDLRIVDASSNVVGVATTKTININNNPVDVTGDDDQGFVTLLSRPGTKQITMDVTFVFDDAADVDLRAIALSGSGLLAEYSLEFLDNADQVTPTAIYTITGDFYLATVSITGASDGRIEGTASIQSSGEWEVATA